MIYYLSWLCGFVELSGVAFAHPMCSLLYSFLLLGTGLGLGCAGWPPFLHHCLWTWQCSLSVSWSPGKSQRCPKVSSATFCWSQWVTRGTHGHTAGIEFPSSVHQLPTSDHVLWHLNLIKHIYIIILHITWGNYTLTPGRTTAPRRNGTWSVRGEAGLVPWHLSSVSCTCPGTKLHPEGGDLNFGNSASGLIKREVLTWLSTVWSSMKAAARPSCLAHKWLLSVMSVAPRGASLWRVWWGGGLCVGFLGLWSRQTRLVCLWTSRSVLYW